MKDALTRRGFIRNATVGVADFAIQLRAERDGHREGRVYDIVYRATDCFGVAVSGHTTVLVPHDQGDVGK